MCVYLINKKRKCSCNKFKKICTGTEIEMTNKEKIGSSVLNVGRSLSKE